MNYKALKKNKFSSSGYSLVPLRRQDLELIRVWRNQQIKILRQKKIIAKNEQIDYFNSAIKPSYSAKRPAQILFSFLLKKRCFGYGGLVHINWRGKIAEVSFLAAMSRANNHKLYQKEFGVFLNLLKEIAFNQLKLKKIFTETFAIRPLHVSILEKNGFRQEKRLKKRVKIDGKMVDSLIHGCLKKSYVK